MIHPASRSSPLLRRALAAVLLVAVTFAYGQPAPSLRDSTPEEQALDAAAFVDVADVIAQRYPDVRSVVVLLRGRTVYQWHRDGDPDALRPVHSIAKSALAGLVGAALAQGHIASVDQRVVDLVPEWRGFNADPRAQGITLRHLLTMTAGFEVDDPTGTAPALPVREAWARTLRHEPGAVFAYDNSIVNLVSVLLEKASGRPLAEFVREQFTQPMDMAQPRFGPGVAMRTIDMAKLGQLFLDDGRWNGKALMPPGFAATATRAHNGGGAPAGVPYGYFWWVPSAQTYFASGYGGQLIWVHPPMRLVVAATSAASPGSQRRGEVLGLVRGPVFAAVRKREAVGR